MKLVLANNQTDQFVNFHRDIQGSEHIYDYIGYRSLLFYFEKGVTKFTNVEEGAANNYAGVYLNGYLSTPEIAVTMARVLEHNGINYVNHELGNAPSLTKLSAYAALAAANVSIPKTFGGSAYALIHGIDQQLLTIPTPFILKRADADRGIDNYKIDSYDRAKEILSQQEERSLWVIQEFIDNDGFYLVSYYDGQPKFSIFRSLEERPDGKQELAHMFKPKGGANATMKEINELPGELVLESNAAISTLNRQIGSVDLLYSADQHRAYVLEVNYNPQLVTIETFKEVRQQAFLDAIRDL
jgi:glutathione synthase/RimK-type ligase-like ATP-grasp enzyme